MLRQQVVSGSCCVPEPRSTHREANRAVTANFGLFDSHAHLDVPGFDGDRAQVLARARDAGINGILVPAIAASGWPGLHALCLDHPDLHAAYGLHPCWLDRHQDGDLAALEAWLGEHPAVAVGECGLDLFPGHADVDRQLRLLRGQFAIALNFDVPLVLHARRAFEQVILELRRFGKPLRGVVHSFSGSLEQARQLRDLGFAVGIGGAVTHPRAKRLQRVVAELPDDQLLLETDAPDQPGAGHRGQRNEPAWIVEVLDCMATLRDQAPADLARATASNARALFGLSG